MTTEDFLTSVKIMSSTRDAIRSKGKKGETYDDILRKLLGLEPSKPISERFWDMTTEENIKTSILNVVREYLEGNSTPAEFLSELDYYKFELAKLKGKRDYYSKPKITVNFLYSKKD